MLFNSYVFIFAFLPVVFAIHYALRRSKRDRFAVAFLALASLFFYGWWNPVYVILIGVLILANYACVRALIEARGPAARTLLLVVGIGGNLCVLGYYKYANFFVDNLNALTGLELYLNQIILPLGISFFTFQKIALLADTYEGKVRKLDFLDYALFVLFFPQLIAGPIVHHSEAMPQFQARRVVSVHEIAMGLTSFIVGLSKKVLLADTLSGYATSQFDAAASGGALSFLGAWSGALAYTFQLYFDFSGYSDMAIGAALLFGVRLPLNFNSPYKARNIIDFWRRWHMTLSRFLRDYLYIPLGGNRLGPLRRYLNLFITMLLGGLWHGAGWTFIVWGALHGAYLAINHAWDALARHGSASANPGAARRLAGYALTFLAVVVGWVFFRADSLAAAFSMLGAMTEISEVRIGLSGEASSELPQAFLLIGIAMALVGLVPNTQELVGYEPYEAAHRPSRPPEAKAGWQWQPSAGWAILAGSMAAVSLLSLSKVSEFLYFQF
jgi:D-alanyl-lipoteichoic acid acyltransferase DltB (MBOAT superfamily)